VRTRVKICGLKRPKDVELAARLGADAVGFVFADGPRKLTPYQARDLVATVPPWVSRVGVFGPEQKLEAAAIAEACRLDTLQLHGAPDAAFCAYIRGRFSVVQALGIARQSDSHDNGGAKVDLEALQAAIDAIAPHVDGILLDTSVKGQLGGTGEVFDWSVLATLKSTAPLMIAGGLKPENVRNLLAAHDPWGVDVSSGIETSPGIKDGRRMADFIAAVSGR
jgi:phosphoribosylanthranilate isomerase